MAEGKILFEDLFDPKLIAQIAQLRADIAAIQKDLSNLKTTLPKTGNNAGDTEKLNAAQKERIRLQEKLVAVETEEYQANQKLKEQLKEKAAQMSAQGSAYKQLNLDMQKNIKAYKDLAAANKAGSDEGKKLLATITEQDKKIKDIDKSVGQHQRNVGNYTSALGGLKGGLMNVIGALGITGGLAGALTLAKSVMLSTEAGADKFQATLSGIGSATSFLARSLATMDFTNLIQGFKDAYKAGVDYAEALDLEEDVVRAAELRKKDIDNQIIALRTEARLKTTSLDKKKENLEKIRTLENEKLKINQDVADAAVERELSDAEKITKADRKLILELIQNKGEYVDAMEEAAKVEEEIAKNTTTYVTDRRTGIMQTVQDYEAYKKAIAALTPEQQKMIELNRIDAILDAKKRDLIANALGQQLDATNQMLSANEALIRIENKVATETEENAELINATIEKFDLSKINEENEKFINDWLETEEDYLDKENDLSGKWIDQQMKITENNLKKYEDAAKRLDEILGLENQSYIQKLQERQAILDADHENRLISEQEYLNASLILQQEIELEKAAITAETFGQAASLFEEHTAAYKVLASAQALINTYLMATQAYLAGLSVGGPYGLILGPIMAAIAVAAGLANVAKINNVKFEEGEIDIKGRRHAQGGIMAEIEGGESVINRRGTANARKTLELINTGKVSDNMLIPVLAMQAAGRVGGQSLTVNNTEVVAEIKKTNDLLGKFKFYSKDGSKVMDIHGNLVRYV